MDHQPVISPYEVRAIGDPTGMQAALFTTSEIRALAGLALQLGLVFTTIRAEDMQLGAAPPTQITTATPVPQ